MRINFYGLLLETPHVTFHLWSPWRASALEHRLFEAVRSLPKTQAKTGRDELCVHIGDAKTCEAALKAVSRVLKGWQEEAEQGSERRTWRWLLEGDTDDNGYDHNNEPVTLCGFLRLGLDRGGPGEENQGEDLDLEDFGLRIWGAAGEK